MKGCGFGKTHGLAFDQFRYNDKDVDDTWE